ncbi:MAG: hypothetical protein AAF360_14175, partial [Pseudomonadota bacterium]
TLMVTPAALSIRVWIEEGVFRRYGFFHRALAYFFFVGRRRREFWVNARRRNGFRASPPPGLIWDDEGVDPPRRPLVAPAPQRAYADAAE